MLFVDLVNLLVQLEELVVFQKLLVAGAHQGDGGGGMIREAHLREGSGLRNAQIVRRDEEGECWTTKKINLFYTHVRSYSGRVS